METVQLLSKALSLSTSASSFVIPLIYKLSFLHLYKYHTPTISSLF